MRIVSANLFFPFVNKGLAEYFEQFARKHKGYYVPVLAPCLQWELVERVLRAYTFVYELLRSLYKVFSPDWRELRHCEL